MEKEKMDRERRRVVRLVGLVLLVVLLLMVGRSSFLVLVKVNRLW